MRAMVAAGLVLVAGGVGAEEVREKLAGELLVAMGAERQASMALEQVRRNQDIMLKAARLPPGQEAKAREMQERVAAVIAEEFSWAKWKAEYTQFYAATFSEQELKDLLAFYQSPAGRTYVAKAPEIQKLAQEHVLRRMASVNERARTIQDEYKPRTAVLPAAPAETPAPVPAPPAASAVAPAPAP